ncbi:MAG: winged helix-turn-helix domain-containing protein [Proteobacteria bacterium]|nr:winged helix-turn-helix domain-containing protein [Pseudomonadota bacterium]
MPRTTAATRPAKPDAPQARFRLRVTAGDVIAIGPGKIALLEAVARTGSITTAAKSLDMSYRRAWMLLDELNSQLKSPAVDSSKGGQHGGGTALTPVGERLVETYRRIETTAEKATATDMRALVRLLNR